MKKPVSLDERRRPILGETAFSSSVAGAEVAGRGAITEVVAAGSVAVSVEVVAGASGVEMAEAVGAGVFISEAAGVGT